MPTAPRDAPATPATERGELAVVTRPGGTFGFRLAGVRCEEIAPGEGELARLRELFADPSIALLAVEDALLEAVPAPVLRRLASRGRPILFSFPVPRRLGDRARGRDYVAALVQRFIGYHVKLGAEVGT